MVNILISIPEYYNWVFRWTRSPSQMDQLNQELSVGGPSPAALIHTLWRILSLHWNHLQPALSAPFGGIINCFSIIPFCNSGVFSTSAVCLFIFLQISHFLQSSPPIFKEINKGIRKNLLASKKVAIMKKGQNIAKTLFTLFNSPGAMELSVSECDGRE